MRNYSDLMQSVYLVLRPAETVCHPRDGEKPASGVTIGYTGSGTRCQVVGYAAANALFERAHALPLGVRGCLLYGPE